MDSNVASIPTKLIQREQVQEVRQAIFNHREDPALRVVHQLASHQLDRCKDQLLSASGEELYRLQGEGKAWSQLLKALTEPPRVLVDRDNAA